MTLCPSQIWLGGTSVHKKGIENALSHQSRKVRFLDLLAQQRAKGGAVHFQDIDLSHLDLSHVDLCGIDFTGANFSNANLSGSKMIGANFTNAKFHSTILVNANVTDANWTNVSMDRITQLAWQQVANQKWFDAAQKTIPGFNQQWKRLKSAEGFNAFETMLKRVNEWSLRDSITTAEIVDVIYAVLKSDDIAKLVFELAHGADVKCHYHLLTIFNAAQCVCQFGTMLAADDTHDEILSLAKAMVRQNLLDDATLPVMREQWSDGRRGCNGQGTGPNVGDALKVQLALRHQLVGQLALPFPIKNSLNSAHVAALTESDKSYAVDFIHQYLNEQEQLVRSLMNLPVWELYLTQVLGESDRNTLLQETEKMVCAEYSSH